MVLPQCALELRRGIFLAHTSKYPLRQLYSGAKAGGGVQNLPAEDKMCGGNTSEDETISVAWVSSIA